MSLLTTFKPTKLKKVPTLSVVSGVVPVWLDPLDRPICRGTCVCNKGRGDLPRLD